ncbi:HNH endonuclease signature motif containing protein [Brachybacterium sp. GU-2]|uniref:HNH endonuclease signature motif containing protein n=1 Tax=Brachybacterium sp. GU-2 TaxID=3069708 RepID=UPI00280B7F8C|nr:HNH endonuclease signature motif containing protein [Brachybacterium sp. GU-2]WME22388.1 HNH endonuclease signature motif containing protein [Brachybacterium sp. GU-2]
MSITQPEHPSGDEIADDARDAVRSERSDAAAPDTSALEVALPSVLASSSAVTASPSAPATTSPDPADDALIAALPARFRRVGARQARTRDALPDLGGCADDPALSEAAQRVWGAERATALALAAQYRALAALHEFEGEYEDACELDEVETLCAALGLRVTRSAASWRLRDAYQAVNHFPRTLENLESGSMPSAWFQKMLKTSQKLSESSRRHLDAVISTWSTDISPERFFTLLRALIEHLAERESRPDPVAALERTVELLPGAEAGTGTLRITGPIPEILARWKSIDESARAVQAAQRAALRDGTPIPHDPDGVVLGTGRALPLTRLRYALIDTADLDVDGVAVPAERFRLNVTVPVLTLLGASDQAGMLDGVTPLPPSMARSLAGSCTVWHRVLTSASSGAFLPLPADRVTPTPAMLEHLRLRNGQCAVPGCTRPTSWASECDHIEECLRGTPGEGGATEVENLHLLCWQHHLDKTNGLLDPTRLPTQAGKPGRTRWTIGRHGDAVTVLDDLDHASLEMVELLTAAWTGFLRGAHAGSPATSPNSPPETPGEPRMHPASLVEEPTLRTQVPPGPPPTAGPPAPRDQQPGAEARAHADPPPHPAPRPDTAPPPRTAPPDPPPEGWGDYGPPPF